jgi:hypothetical protein
MSQVPCGRAGAAWAGAETIGTPPIGRATVANNIPMRVPDRFINRSPHLF